MTDIVDTPVSTSSTGNETLTLADEIKKYDTGALISFLQERGLELSETAIKILEKEEIDGCAFLKLSKQDFRDYGMPGGPTIKLVDFAKECKEKKLRAFSTYRSLKEVLEKYNLASEGTEIIPLFTPRIHEIPDENKHLELCMADIKLRLKSYGTLVITSLESMRNEYVSTILHTALRIAEDITKKKFSMRPEYEIIGDESSGRVDYAIKESEELICITEDKVQQKLTEGFAQNIKQLESSFQTNKRKRKRDEDYFDYLYGVVTSARDWHFLLYSPGEILQASKAPFSIEFVEEALVENSEEYKTLRKGVKKVLGIIIGLLEDRACVEDKSDRKRARIEGYRNSAKHLNGKPLEEKDMDSFLLEAHKKIVSSEIKQRNKEKKFLRKSANQDSISDTAYVSETVVVAPQLVIADTPQEEIPTVDSKVTHDIKVVNRYPENSYEDAHRMSLEISEEFEKTVPSGNDQSHVSSVKPDLEVSMEQDDEQESLDKNQIIEQGLIQELCGTFDTCSPISSDDNISSTNTNSSCNGSENMISGSAQHLSYLFDTAIKSGQQEILDWYNYSLEFESRVDALTADGRIKDKTARSKIYKEMKPFLPAKSHKITCARKLLGLENTSCYLEKMELG